jgi:probable addiction module antidote protein
MAIERRRWDSANYLKTKQDIAHYLDAVLEDGDDTELLKDALGAVARSQGMTEIAKEAGLSRSSLYKALSPDGASWPSAIDDAMALA